MSQSKPPFLNRQAEREHLRSLLRQRKSLLLYGPAGIGKSSLLEELARQNRAEDPSIIFSPGNLDPARWLRRALAGVASQPSQATLRRRLGLPASPAPAEARAVLARKSAGAVRTVLFETLEEGSVALVLDPAGFLSRPFYELLRDLERCTGTPLVLVARSPHMEDIGYASKFVWPREQYLSVGPLPAAETERLFDLSLAGWPRHPSNVNSFRTHVLDYAARNPGTVLGLLALAREATYWADDRIKTHLLTVDFNLRGWAALVNKQP